MLAERLALLIDDLTESIFTNICRGLFEKVGGGERTRRQGDKKTVE